VLGRFSPAERPVLEESIERAADAVEFAQTHGFPAAMNRYNQLPTT
jgi:peptidyl-tRNA hydrolase